MNIFVDLINNVALLLALCILYRFLIGIWKHGEMTGRVLSGLLFGGVAVAGMMNSFHYAPGIIFDGRSVVLSMSGLFGGPVTAVIAFVTAALYRLLLGGAGALTGAGVMFTSAVLGVGYYYISTKRPDAVKPFYLYCFGVVVHIFMLLWMLTLPWPIAFGIIDKIWLPVMLIFPLATLILGTVLADQVSRRQAEEELQGNEEKYRSLVDSTEDSIYLVDKENRYLFINQKHLSRFSLSRDKVIGRTYGEFHSEEETKEFAEKVKKVLETGKSLLYEYRSQRDGRYFIRTLSPVKEPGGRTISVTVVSKDINERRQTEDSLRESEERFRDIANSMADWIWEVDAEGQYTYCSNRVKDVLGYSAAEMLGKTPFDFMEPEEVEKNVEIFNKISRKKGQIRNLQNWNVSKDGRRVCLLTNGVPIFDEKGNLLGYRGVDDNISDRKQAEEALRESEEKFKSLSRNAPDIVYSLGLDGTFAYLNPAFEKILGFKTKEALGKYFADFGLKKDAKKYVMLFKLVRDEKKTVKDETITLIHKDGSSLLFNANGAPNFDKEGNVTGVVGLLKDITEHRKLEDQLHRAQKMEALGLMAGGVAHDLNNILSGIVSYPELLLMDLPEDSPLRKPIKAIQESGKSAVDVVADLMTIVRGVATGREILKLNMVVEEYLSSAEHQKLKTMHSFITFKTELDSDPLNISCSPTHIKKALMNLVVNASEAIEGRGTVTISSTNRYLDEPLKGYENIRQGEYAVLSVSDQGTGISTGDLEKIFEPFYTKKVMGRSGTGLGLAIVWNTVQDHKGYINVKSSDEGTVFELYFRVTREEVAAEKEEVPLEDYLGHGEKILVVDDEERQIEIASGMLAKLGYNAEAVSSGEEAIEYVKDHSVDLIVLDMVMPKGINGRKTYEEIIKIHPGQKAIIASGYAKTKEVDIAQKLGAGKYIKKPYTLEKVGLAVKEELEK